MASSSVTGPVHAVVQHHPECPAHLPHGVNDGDGHLLACHATKQEAQDLALHLDISDASPAPAPGGDTADSPAVTADPAAAAAAAPAPAAPVPTLATWEGVELVAVGEWDLSTGHTSFTTADLQSAVGAADCPAVGRPILKLGHNDPRFDGEPAIGWVGAMRLNDSMTKIVGDFCGMPGWLGEILPSAYPERSVEGGWNFPCQMGHVHPFVITAVALLGCTPPGVGIIASLSDIATLYGIEAAAPADPAVVRPFTLTLPGDAIMPPAGSTIAAAGTNTTIDDVRREFYESAPWSQWIIELQLDPLVLIVSDDASGDLYRVPVTIDAAKPGEVAFGDPETVLVQYISAPIVKAEAAKGGPHRFIAAAWASRDTSRDGMPGRPATAGGQPGRAGPVAATWDSAAQVANLGDDPTATQLKAMFALPADTKSDSKLPHHVVSADGVVGAADTDGCTAAIGALNGARGGLADVSADDKQAAYTHLAAHVKAAGGDPPELAAAAAGNCPDCDGTGDCAACGGTGKMTAAAAAAAAGDCATCGGSGKCKTCGGSGTMASAAGPGIEVDAAGAHGPFDGEHAHPHSAFGAQGDDETHDHMHRHSGDGVHSHAHDPASSAPPSASTAAASRKEGNPDMEFTSEQMAAIRQRLGKKDGEDITAAEIAAAFAGPTVDAAAARPDSDGKLPPIGEGSYLVDSEILRDWQSRAAAGDHALHQLRIYERDQVLAEAVRVGKFPQSKLETYSARWDLDPEGTRELVGALAAGLVPVGTGPVGHPGFDADMPGDFEAQQAYRDLYPEDAAGPGAGVQAAGARGGRRG